MDNKERESFIEKYFNSHTEERLKMVSITCCDEPFLYRYRPMINEHDFQALEENYFWQQTLNSQNDKEEGLIDLTYDYIKHSSSNVLRKICSIRYIEASQKIAELNIEMREQLKKYREPYGVVCFSESNISDKMWRKYANEYQGICIAYSKKNLIDNRFHLVPTLYKQKKYIIDYFIIEERKRNELSVVLIDNQTEKILISKTVADWGYEREWRHIDDINKGNCIPAIKPEKIYIGCNCAPMNKERIIEYCINNDVEFVIQEVHGGEVL